MPRLTKGIDSAEVRADTADTWQAIKIGSSYLGGAIPPKTRLTNLVVQVTTMTSLSDRFYFGLSEDEAGNHPITGNFYVDLDDVEAYRENVSASFSWPLNMDYIAVSPDNPGHIWFWWKCDATTTTVRATIFVSET